MNTTIWKMMLSYCLSLMMILPVATVANAKNASPAARQDRILIDYSDFAARYLTDCDDIGSQPRPSGARLKHCLTIAQSLLDKFDTFVQRLKTIRQKLELGRVLTKEFEERFLREASRFGVDAETLSDVRKAGGLKAFLDQNLPVLERSKGELALEVRELEAKVRSLGAGSAFSFQPISFEPAAESTAVRGRLRTILKIAKKIAIAIIAACELAGDACD